MNIDASLAKAVTKFANKKMKSFYNDNSFPSYRECLEKDIAKTALEGQNSVEYFSSNDEKFYKFLLNICHELKKKKDLKLNGIMKLLLAERQ